MEVEEHEDTLLVRRNAPLQKANVKTLPYPGFPTDMQPQITAVLCLAQGTSLVTESVWNNRYRYVDELKRMGASIQVDDKTAVVEGVELEVLTATAAQMEQETGIHNPRPSPALRSRPQRGLRRKAYPPHRASSHC